MRILLFLAVVAALYGSLSTGYSEMVSARSSELFRLKETPQARPVAERSSIASRRESEIEFTAPFSQLHRAQIQSFPLFDGRIYQAELTSVEVRGSNDVTWRGKLVGSDNDVIFTFKGGYVSALIYSAEGVYEIVPVGSKHILVELDQKAFPNCAGDVKTPPNTSQPGSVVPQAGVDSGDRIDVLVLYTAAVRTSLGGEAQAQTFAQSAIDSANTTYLNSKMRQRIRLVSAQVTTLVETGSLSTELSAIRAAAETTALRDQFKADLVALISNSADNCGIGYLGSTGGNTTSAFTVTSRTCAVGNLSFAHELGHNMGSQHNPENGSGAAYPYAYGHYVNGVFRTVMSYVDPCPAGCTRRPYFSNPSVLFNGLSTGIENARDNSRSLNNMSDVIAGYRYSGSSITMNNYSEAASIPRLISRTVNWSSDGLSAGTVKIELSRNEGTSWETLVASTSNDGAETITLNGRPTKNARLRITSLESPTVSDSSIRNITIR